MSTSFNPSIPSDKDTVYDAYFSFHRNMESINNLLDVDHYNGTSAQFHGMHRMINFPEPLATTPSVQGNAGVLYTGTTSVSGSSNAPVIFFANREGRWEIPLFSHQPGGGGGNRFNLEESILPEEAKGSGYYIFDSKFTVCWIREVVYKNQTKTEVFPVNFARLFFITVETTESKNLKFSFKKTSGSYSNPLLWEATKNEVKITNKTKSDCSFQIIALGRVV